MLGYVTEGFNLIVSTLNHFFKCFLTFMSTFLHQLFVLTYEI